MDTIICRTSAYQFWRTPPIVKLLAAGSEDNPLLPKLVAEAELTAFRSELAARLPLAQACAIPQRTQGQDLRSIREAWPLLAPGLEPPISLLASTKQQRHSCQITRYALWQGDLPIGSTREIAYDLSVTSPAFTLLQLASKSTPAKTALLASELCGSYAVYHAPQPVAAQLQRMIDRGNLPAIGGWCPCLSPDRRLTDLWSRPPLVTLDELEDIIVQSDSRNGKRTLSQAIKLIKPFAASPFETQAGALLGFPTSYGGEGFGDFTFNEKVDLTPEARLLAQRSCCYCDLYWADGLDVECQSASYHDNAQGFISDSDRTAALSLVGINVLPLTYAQLNDARRFDAFCEAVAMALGRPRKQKTEKQLLAARQLRNELFVDWWKLPFTASFKK